MNACCIPGPVLNSLFTLSYWVLQNPYAIGTSITRLVFRRGNLHTEKESILPYGYKARKHSVSRASPLAVFSNKPPDASEKMPLTCAAPVPGLGWGAAASTRPPFPLGLQPLTSVLIIWHKSAPQLHECHGREHL